MADEVKVPVAPAPSLGAAPAEPAKPVEPVVAKPAEVVKPVEPAKPEASLLGEPPKAPEPKGEAAKAAETLKDTKVGDAKAEAAKPAEPKPGEAAPVDYKFKLPEGMTLADKELGKFKEILGKHHASQEQAQDLMDLYTSESSALVSRLESAQRDTWVKLNESWIAEIRADPEIGGNRIDTVLQATRNLVEQYGGNASEKKALRDMLGMTGAGNHPTLVRFLYRIAKAQGEGSPVPAPTPQASPDKTNLTRAQRRYGNGAAVT